MHNVIKPRNALRSTREVVRFVVVVMKMRAQDATCQFAERVRTVGTRPRARDRHFATSQPPPLLDRRQTVPLWRTAGPRPVPRLPHGAFRVASPVRPKPPISIINIHRFPLFNIVKQAYCQDSCAPRVSQCQSIHDPYTPIFPRLIAARRPY